jgi:hypothetical protein
MEIRVGKKEGQRNLRRGVEDIEEKCGTLQENEY